MDYSLPEKVYVWIADRPNYVDCVPGTILRIKRPEDMGRSYFEVYDLVGQVHDLSWDAFFKIRPTRIEICQKDNPVTHLITAIEKNYNQEQISQFFEEVEALHLCSTDVPADILLKLLKNLTRLATFSFSDTKFNEKYEWPLILNALGELNLRGIEVSCNILEQVNEKLSVPLMVLSGCPRIDIAEFKKGIRFESVRALVAEELEVCRECMDIDDGSDTDAEQFLEVLPQSFPSLQTLVFNWKIVHPDAVFHERTKKILKSLADIFESSNLETLAIVACTSSAYSNTESAIGEMDEYLDELFKGKQEVQLYHFEVSKMAHEDPRGHFSIIIIGNNGEINEELIKMYIDGRAAFPRLEKFLRLVQEDIEPVIPAVTIDFAGFPV